MAKEMRVCRKCGRNRDAKFYVGVRGKTCATCRRTRTRGASKDVRLQETYGITLDEWQAILAAQGGGCAICGGKRPTYDTDHDHAFERAGFPPRETVRGILCRRCNRRLLPACKDDPDILGLAIKYLIEGREHTQEILRGKN